MRIKLLNPNEFIKGKLSKEVESSQLFTSSGSPNKKGLLSPDIFGYTPDEKSMRSGYIKLPTRYIHPNIYRAFFKRRYRNIDSIINGTKKYKIESNGNLIEDENGDTGIDWFYENFNKINLKASDDDENDRIMSTLIKRSYKRLNKEEIFINKFIVIPLIFRDVSREGNMVKVDELNTMYQNLIALSNIRHDSDGNMLIDKFKIDMKIQMKIVEIYNYFYDKIDGKDGIQKRNTMGRRIDHTSRDIISAPSFSGDFGSSPIDMKTAGYPLSAVIACFTPMFIFNLKSFFRQAKDMKYINCSEDDFESYYDNDFIKDLINKYIKSWGERFNNISATAGKEATGKEPSYITVPLQIVDGEGNKTVIDRKLTILELFYSIAYITVELANKVTLITRYPIINKYNIIATKIHVLSTVDTIHATYEGVEMPYYPNIMAIEEKLKGLDVDEYEETVAASFHETIKMSNCFLQGFNGDYDGDSLNNKSIMTDSATAEVIGKMDNMINTFTIGGDIMLYVKGEPQQALYSLSIDPKKDAKVVKREYIERILKQPADKFNPHFIFGECGMAKLKSGRINKHYDIVVLKKGDYPGITTDTKTTLGRLLINKVVFSHARLNYMNIKFTGKNIEKIFLSLRDHIFAGNITMDEFHMCLKVFEDFGFRMSSFISPSTDADVMRPNKVIMAKRDELFKKYEKELANNDVEASIKVENELIATARKIYDGSDYIENYESGASSKMGYSNDFKVSQLLIGAIPKGLGSGEFYVSKSNFIEGIKKDEIHVMGGQMITALHAKVQGTAVGGYMAKQAGGIFQAIQLDRYGSDCKTHDGIAVELDKDNISGYIGRYLTDGTQIDSKNRDKLIGKTVMMRSPYMCEGKLYCSKCSGEMPYKLMNEFKEPINIGLDILEIYTDLSQASLQKTHKMTAQLCDIGDINRFII